MRSIKHVILLLCACGYMPYAHGQIVSTIPVRAEECFFVYEVKLIDEFIERFNDDKGSYIRAQCVSMYGTDSIVTRRRLLLSLFNKGQQWNAADVTAFVDDVAGKRQQHLDFAAGNWYVLANSVFTVNGKKTEIPLILHISTKNGASKWMVAGIGKSDVISGAGKTNAGNSTPGGGYIPTSSHGTNFVVFNRVFSGGMNEADYLEPELLRTERAGQFVSMVKQGKATFKYVKGIRYYFYGVDGWIFTVDQYKRKDTNKGWLISSLQRVNGPEKTAQLKKLLYP